MENIQNGCRGNQRPAGSQLPTGRKGFPGIMGPSGSGKSTLLHLAGILDLPTKGEVILNGKNVSKLSGKEQAHLRRTEISFVFQRFNLLSQLTAEELN
nr:ATP-binding cassette domain-containing protein [uncultured Methanobacterium sp.]